ncbi:MAG TPA: AbrB/MazE/SpoVT family DNA-binding domain-containing protein [Terriglobales bacterium]|nr:AbrB/MazE/SpoVT family DNA-binding domain-containing protein [Terriglobales bacterium]
MPTRVKKPTRSADLGPRGPRVGASMPPRAVTAGRLTSGTRAAGALGPAPAKPPDIARIFMHGRSQAVRLPKAFRLPGDRVRVRRVGQTLVLEPLAFDVQAWYAELDRLAGGQFPAREPQPPMPPVRAWDK